MEGNDGPGTMVAQVLRGVISEPIGIALRDSLAGVPSPAMRKAILRDGDMGPDGLLAGTLGAPDLAELQERAANLPYFIRTRLAGTDIDQQLMMKLANVTLHEWQKRFWREAWARWNPGWDQPMQQQRLLQVACTGSGKTDAIALAPFAGARERCLVVVPEKTCEDGLRAPLGAPPRPDHPADAEGGMQLPTLVSRGLLDLARCPKVLVLGDIGKKVKGQQNPNDEHIYRYPRGTDPRNLIDIVLEHDIVMCTIGFLRASERVDYFIEHTQTLGRPVFDLMITDEAHHYPKPTWTAIAAKFREVTPPNYTFNELLLTATPNHHANGNLDTEHNRDAPRLTSFTLLDGREANPRVVKDVFLLEIQEMAYQVQSWADASLEVLRLVGDHMRQKMTPGVGTDTYISHRALVLVPKRQGAQNNLAQVLVQRYNEQDEDMKPILYGDVRMNVAAYYGTHNPTNNNMLHILENFNTTNVGHPVHCLIQIEKLSEGYDQPNISVLGICTDIPKPGKFAQFVGRSVRRINAHNVEVNAQQHISEIRDNRAHVITHAKFRQSRHWEQFASQEGWGEFIPDEEIPDDEEEIAEDQAAEDVKEGIQKRARSTRTVHRWVLARDINGVDGQVAKLAQESAERDGALQDWTIEDQTYVGQQ